jgi:hypothetical protein
MSVFQKLVHKRGRTSVKRILSLSSGRETIRLRFFGAKLLKLCFMGKSHQRLNVEPLFFRKPFGLRAWVLKDPKIFSDLSRLPSFNKSYGSAIHHNSFFCKNTNGMDPVVFNEWFTGVSDGAGTFSMTKDLNGEYEFTFKIRQSRSNYYMLYYIKKQLGFGSITKDGLNYIQYRIRDTQILKNILVPFFENYPLHTSKYYSYTLFKESLCDPTKRHFYKSQLTKMPSDFKSPYDAIPTKNWIIGFTEVKGSFCLIKKDLKRIIYAFGITQKLDIHILEQLKKIFGIKAKVLRRKNAFLLETTNGRNIKYLIDYYHGTLKGVKSLEYRIWARSFVKKSHPLHYESQIRNANELQKKRGSNKVKG